MRWTEHVARIGEMTSAYTILVENLKGTDNTEDLSVDERIILERILEKWCRAV
jgi:hypothetical protein